MSRGTLIFIFAIILIIGGFLTIQIIANGPENALPVRVQTENPEASTMAATPNQAVFFVVFAIIGVGSLIGGGVVLAFLLRFIDKEIASSKK